MGGLELRRRNVADGLEQTAMVEPVHPLEGGVLDLVDAPPGAAPADELGLAQADDRLGQSVVVRVPSGADRRHPARFGQALGVADRQVLAPAIGVVYEP